METKEIKNQRIPIFFYNKQQLYMAVAITMLGAIGALFFIAKVVCAEYFDNVVFDTDDWIGCEFIPFWNVFASYGGFLFGPVTYQDYREN